MIIFFRKLTDDAAVPTISADIKAGYETIKDQLVITLKQYLTDRGLYNGSIVGKRDAEVEINMLTLTTEDLESNNDLEAMFEEI